MAIEECDQPTQGNTNISTSSLFRRKDVSMAKSSVKTYSLAAVADHSTPTDCWVVVREKVYDVTAWVPQHPGGALIYISAGKECTQLFDSYHPLHARYQGHALHGSYCGLVQGSQCDHCCRAVLEKFYIGDVAREPSEAAAVRYQQPAEQQQFYTVLRQRVEKYFRKNAVWNCMDTLHHDFFCSL